MDASIESAPATESNVTFIERDASPFIGFPQVLKVKDFLQHPSNSSAQWLVAVFHCHCSTGSSNQALADWLCTVASLASTAWTRSTELKALVHPPLLHLTGQGNS